MPQPRQRVSTSHTAAMGWAGAHRPAAAAAAPRRHAFTGAYYFRRRPCRRPPTPHDTLPPHVFPIHAGSKYPFPLSTSLHREFGHRHVRLASSRARVRGEGGVVVQLFLQVPRGGHCSLVTTQLTVSPRPHSQPSQHPFGRGVLQWWCMPLPLPPT